MSYVIQTQDLWKTYDGINQVLRGINLGVKEGEKVLIWGRNGSGKTTLLNLIGCMDVPSRGKVFLEGKEISNLSPKERAKIRLRKVGFVFQDHNLINDLTIEENLFLPAKLARSRNVRERVSALLSTFRLSFLSDKKPNQISVGERQMVAIARAMVNNPAILLADEPTASLDSENAEIVLEAFRKANHELGATLLLVSHDPIQEDFQQRYLLSKGELRLEGRNF